VPASLRRRAPLPSITPLPHNVNPFQELVEASAVQNVRTIKFARTNLDTQAEATADVALKSRTLLVRMQANDVPLPTTFGTPRYAMWVYVPNYGVRIYIGDLPIVPTSKTRGKSDSAYRYLRMPPNSVFGGLMLTAEPVRYEPIVNEPLRPLLVGLAEGINPRYANSALTIYSYPLPPARQRGRRTSPKPRAGAKRSTVAPRRRVGTN
jgi:hypothetical protein